MVKNICIYFLCVTCVRHSIFTDMDCEPWFYFFHIFSLILSYVQQEHLTGVSTGTTVSTNKYPIQAHYNYPTANYLATFYDCL